MNNKGFIATSLIYSFFLIFVTLFLGIIADYLQDKVLLNTIEKGIKEDLNSTMGIQDFEVGDVLMFNDGISLTNATGICKITDIKYKNSYDSDGRDLIICEDGKEIDITDKRLEKALQDGSNNISITGVKE